MVQKRLLKDIKKFIKEYYSIKNIIPKTNDKFIRKNGEEVNFLQIYNLYNFVNKKLFDYIYFYVVF